MDITVKQMLSKWIDRIRRDRMDVNEGAAECRRDPQGVLVDVREADEYASGHIPGAVNVPLSGIRRCDLPGDARLYVYCLRGSRSRRAVSILARMGYDVRSIGGINRYKGERER